MSTIWDKLGNYLKLNTDGSINTQLIGSLANQVPLQVAVSAPGNGTPYTPASPMTLSFEITGTSTSRTTFFEIAGPKGVYQAHPAYKLGDTTYTPQTTSVRGSDTTPETWEVDIPANYTFRARISAVAGGNVSISGSAVAK